MNNGFSRLGRRATQLSLLCLTPVFFLLTACSPLPGDTSRDTIEFFSGKPNIIVILTDDQHFKTIEYMPILQDRLAKRGIVFNNAIASIPECCPFRASFLAGGYYPKNTNVKANSYPAAYFNSENTLAVKLSDAGYATGFIGKYKHGYRPGEVPPGWTSFVANNQGGMIRDWFKLKNITYGSNVRDEKVMKVIPDHEQYLTYFHRDEALKFIRERAAQPFFLFVSTYAPHTPAPPPADEKYSENDFAWDEYYQSDLSQKPQWVSNLHDTNKSKHFLQAAKKQIVALQAVDRMIGEIDDLLNELNLQDDTVIFFTSDNGIMFGEHNLPIDKGYPYESSIRVPFIVRAPTIDPRRESSLVAVNLDLAATILDIAGADIESDGVSLVSLISEKKPLSRDSILIENYGYLSWRKFGDYPVWSGYRTNRWKYVESLNDKKELYDLRADPQELNNLAYDDAFQNEVEEFSSRLEGERSLSFTSLEPPQGTVGRNYEYQLTSAWSEPPYRYDVVQRTLPPGLALDKSTGLISGVPTKTFDDFVVIRVRSDRVASQSGQPEHAIWRFKFNIIEQES